MNMNDDDVNEVAPADRYVLLYVRRSMQQLTEEQQTTTTDLFQFS